jgi:hypothetical protein
MLTHTYTRTYTRMDAWAETGESYMVARKKILAAQQRDGASGQPDAKQAPVTC